MVDALAEMLAFGSSPHMPRVADTPKVLDSDVEEPLVACHVVLPEVLDPSLIV